MTNYERLATARAISHDIRNYAHKRGLMFFCDVFADDILHGFNKRSNDIYNAFEYAIDDDEGLAIRSRLGSFLSSAHSGKWCAQIIHTDGADYPYYPYRGEFYFESGEEVLCEGCDWNSFCVDVAEKTGIRLPLRKNMRFFKLSDFEQIAGLDAAHIRGMIQVTKKEIFVNGWRAYKAIRDFT